MTRTFRFMVTIDVDFPLGAREGELQQRARTWLEDATDNLGDGIASAQVLTLEDDVPG